MQIAPAASDRPLAALGVGNHDAAGCMKPGVLAKIA